MRCTFYRPNPINVVEFENIIGKLRYDLQTLCEKPDTTYELNVYVTKLIRYAEPCRRNPKMSFFGIDEPSQMPSDCRVPYVFVPTYIACAFLMKAVLLKPFLLDPNYFETDIEYDSDISLVETMKSCLLGCTARGFLGSFYNEIYSMVETMDLFLSADVDKFVETYPDFCPEFTELFLKCLDFFKTREYETRTRGEWDKEFREEARAVVKKYNL